MLLISSTNLLQEQQNRVKLVVVLRWVLYQGITCCSMPPSLLDFLFYPGPGEMFLS
ncbi:hypothetical protein Zm00014a_023896 [Zea mays]|uniref:Uncharacterized protein n=1 Tax=Zea mays TaxID=4577 RepID=A0A3L6E2H5_MAIZE|nr:hypothetical protein Zm00014a_023896 [Zea mays]